MPNKIQENVMVFYSYHFIIINFKNKIMDWLKKCSELANSMNISDRLKAVEIFATNTKMEEKKGECDNCKYVTKDKRSCNNKDYKDCNIFTNSLFENILDWNKAKKYLDEVRQNYTEIGASGLIAL